MIADNKQKLFEKICDLMTNEIIGKIDIYLKNKMNKSSEFDLDTIENSKNSERIKKLTEKKIITKEQSKLLIWINEKRNYWAHESKENIQKSLLNKIYLWLIKN